MRIRAGYGDCLSRYCGVAVHAAVLSSCCQCEMKEERMSMQFGQCGRRETVIHNFGVSPSISRRHAKIIISTIYSSTIVTKSAFRQRSYATGSVAAVIKLIEKL